MEDLVIMDRNALADLVIAVNMLTKIIKTHNEHNMMPDEELDKLRYINKLIETAMQSFDNHNPPKK